MSYKRLIPCIFIYKGKAVLWFDEQEVIAGRCSKTAKNIYNKAADKLIVLDSLTCRQKEHDEAIDIMKRSMG